MAKFIVTAQAFDRVTGAPVAPKGREELIDTEKNQLFKGLSTILEIKEAYEAFWNHMNDHIPELVFVQQIRRK